MDRNQAQTCFYQLHQKSSEVPHLYKYVHHTLPVFCDSFGWNICRNTYIVEISTENTHDTDAACLIRNSFVSSFFTP